MPHDETNPVTVSKLVAIRKCLAECELKASENSVHGSKISESMAPTVEFLRLGVETKKIETFRDAIIKALWPKRSSPLKKRVADIFEKPKTRIARGFSLARHGLFFPKPRGLYDGKDIWIRSFSHATNYRYRLHRPKAERAPSALAKFLESILIPLPIFYFPNRCTLQRLQALIPRKQSLFVSIH